MAAARVLVQELPSVGGFLGNCSQGDKATPDFGNPFGGLAEDRKLTDTELVGAIRFMIAAEYEAVQLYTQLAEATDNQLAIGVLQDVAGEERVHAGEFLRLLHELAQEEKKLCVESAEEVQETIDKANKDRQS